MLFGLFCQQSEFLQFMPGDINSSLPRQGKPVSCNVSVEIITTQLGVAVGAEHLEDPIFYTQDRNIKGSPTQVIDSNGLCSFLFSS